MHDAVAEPGHRLREQDGEGVHALGDAAQPFGPVIHGVHARHHGEEHLRGADVARGLLAPDVLLARLQRHAERGTAGGIARYADDAAGHVRSEEHTSELQSRLHLVCRLLLEKKKTLYAINENTCAAIPASASTAGVSRFI